MKKSAFSPANIACVLREFARGRSADELAREKGISTATLYKWHQKYNGMEGSEHKSVKELEENSARLKRMYANLAMELDVVKYNIEKSSKAFSEAGDCHGDP
ncbi:transposase [Chryseobacterium sp. Leaf180]|uniref:transposase n=1 Tax=Chryseobacterium sp. Leaf180 TaxID=1736289 RepID=UPI0006F734B1|nr:transposase [Chryseobacterium sp. Leaf180]KQR94234.1 transposase [Chryseobacterium sp. Leaf180]